jgi:hypothetical protein
LLKNNVEKARLLLEEVIDDESIFEGQNFLGLSKKQILSNCIAYEAVLNWYKEVKTI